jgi:DNA-binding MarR family transcriptional regulator
MLASLEALGLVEREVVDLDRRRRHVTLTKAGLQSVRRAARSFIHSGWVELAIDSALRPHRWFNAQECSLARGVLSKILERLRDAYGDRATRNYPWFYDEDFEEELIIPLRSWVTEAVE